MSVTQPTPVQVRAIGDVGADMQQLAAAKVDTALRHTGEPALFAEVVLTTAASPRLDRTAIARATVSLNGRLVRAQAAQPTMREAVNHMADRLRVRLDRAWTHRHAPNSAAVPGEWRHETYPAGRQPCFPRPAAERSVIPRTTVAAGPETAEDAAAEMAALDYDFHLFTEKSTGQDSVIYLAADGFRIAQTRPALSPAVSDGITASERAAPTLTLAEAKTRLNSMGQPFAFFVDQQTGRGNVLYHRYDGHYGLLVPTGAPGLPGDSAANLIR